MSEGRVGAHILKGSSGGCSGDTESSSIVRSTLKCGDDPCGISDHEVRCWTQHNRRSGMSQGLKSSNAHPAVLRSLHQRHRVTMEERKCRREGAEHVRDQRVASSSTAVVGDSGCVRTRYHIRVEYGYTAGNDTLIYHL